MRVFYAAFWQDIFTGKDFGVKRVAIGDLWDRLLSAGKPEGAGSERRAKINAFCRFGKYNTA
jgi:hypothetical protein